MDILNYKYQMNVLFIILFCGDNVTKNMLSFQEKKNLKGQTITIIPLKYSWLHAV